MACFLARKVAKSLQVRWGEILSRLEHLEELEEDLRLFALALTRTITDDGKRYSLEEVAAEFGIDLNTLEED